MYKASKRLLAAVIASSALAASAYAGERINGQAAKPDAPRAAGTVFKAGKAKQLSPLKIDADATRKLTRSADEARAAFTLVGHTRDGKKVRRDPPDDVIRALMGNQATGEKRGDIDIEHDPALPAEDTARIVVGKDYRNRVAHTDDYPFSAIGLLYVETEDHPDDWWTCTATLVGPKTAVTAAHCLYTYEYGKEGTGRWGENFELFPGMNGKDKLPFGSFRYDTVYVFDAWITEYNGSWDSISPYDIGVITFAEPVGESTGYQGYWNFGDDLPSFEPLLIEYPSDKTPEYTMWSTTCGVDKRDIGDIWFVHDCDSNAQNAPMFVYDRREDSRYVIGVNMGVTPDEKRNVAIRLYGPVYEWINAIDTELQ